VDVSIYLNNGQHKYLWFHNGGRSLQIEVPAPGTFKYSEYLLTGVFKGNDLDMSRAVNGHMPSQLNQKNLFKSHTLWVHESRLGKEAYRIIDMPDLLTQFTSVSEILVYMNREFRNANRMDMREISRKANIPAVLKRISSLVDWATNADIARSPISRSAVEIEGELERKNLNR